MLSQETDYPPGQFKSVEYSKALLGAWKRVKVDHTGCHHIILRSNFRGLSSSASVLYYLLDTFTAPSVLQHVALGYRSLTSSTIDSLIPLVSVSPKFVSFAYRWVLLHHMLHHASRRLVDSVASFLLTRHFAFLLVVSLTSSPIINSLLPLPLALSVSLIFWAPILGLINWTPILGLFSWAPILGLINWAMIHGVLGSFVLVDLLLDPPVDPGLLLRGRGSRSHVELFEAPSLELLGRRQEISLKHLPIVDVHKRRAALLGIVCLNMQVFQTLYFLAHILLKAILFPAPDTGRGLPAVIVSRYGCGNGASRLLCCRCCLRPLANRGWLHKFWLLSDCVLGRGCWAVGAHRTWFDRVLVGVAHAAPVNCLLLVCHGYHLHLLPGGWSCGRVIAALRSTTRLVNKGSISGAHARRVFRACGFWLWTRNFLIQGRALSMGIGVGTLPIRRGPAADAGSLLVLVL